MNKYTYLLHVIEAFERCEAISPEEDTVSLWNKESEFWQFQLKRAVVRASEGAITIASMEQFSLADFRDFAYEALARPYLYGEYDGQN